MRARFLASLAIILSLLVASSARAGLKLGDPAPPIKVGKFIKGTPVTSFESGKVYVMEFWATWCGPCIQMIPHITEMQKTYRDQGVTFVSTSVWENEPDQAKVEPFVKEQGDRMNYTVAMDDRADGGAGVMAESWLAAADQNGIPTAFVVDQKGRVVWIGHPMELEPVLKQVLAGTYDLEREAAKANAMSEMNESIMAAVQAKDWDKVIAIFDEGAKKYPDLADDYMMQKFQVQLMRKKDSAAAYATAEGLLKSENAMMLNELGWRIATDPNIEPRNLDVAARLAQRAVDLTKSEDPGIIDTLARVHFLKGDVDKAIELQTKAVEMASGEMKTELQKSLDEFKAAKK